MRRIIIIFFAIILLAIPGYAEILKDQTVSWSNFSYITSIGMGYDYIYFGTTEGLLRYNRITKLWYNPITVSDGMPDEYIHRLAVSPDGEVITIETDLGIYSYDVEFKRWMSELDFPTEYYINSSPNLPLPYLLMPIGYEMSTQGFVADNNFREFQITAFLQDDFDNIFVGTWGMGPMVGDNRDNSIELKPYGLIQKRVDVVYKDGDSLWLAGNEGMRITENRQSRLGVTLYDRKNESFEWIEPRYIHGFDSEIIYDIAGDDKNLYFAGQHGVTINKRGENIYRTLNIHDGLPYTESSALAIRNDSLWIGTFEGLALYTPSVDTMVIVAKDIFGNMFITDLELAGDKLIIGTTRGAYYINFATREVGRLKDPEGNLAGEIRHIAYYDNEIIISSNHGVTIINLLTERTDQLPYVDFANGAYAAAANEFFYAAAVDDGLMLLGRGKKEGKRRLFTTDDGLLSNDITIMLPDGDYLWLGSDEGLTRFKWINPDRVD